METGRLQYFKRFKRRSYCIIIKGENSLSQIFMEINNPVLLFDGTCNLCNNSVKFIIERDKQRLFRFANLGSNSGEKILKNTNVGSDYFDSVILYKEGKIYAKADAVIEILKELPGYKFSSMLLRILPKFIRDFGYDIIAKYRYKVFGRKNYCLMPTPEINKLFLK